MRPVRDANWLETKEYLLLAEIQGSLVSQARGLRAFQRANKMMDLKFTGCKMLNFDF